MNPKATCSITIMLESTDYLDWIMQRVKILKKRKNEKTCGKYSRLKGSIIDLKCVPLFYEKSQLTTEIVGKGYWIFFSYPIYFLRSSNITFRFQKRTNLEIIDEV